MRIVDVRECTVGLQGNMANSVVNFSQHTVSLVALLTDQIRDGQPVVGFAFNSIGRFAQGGILRERLMPRLREAPAEALLNQDGSGFDPHAIVQVVMRDEKPGGHGDRAGAVAALELAVWDANAKLRSEPAWRTLRHCFADERAEGLRSDAVAEVYAAGGYYYAQDSSQRLSDELKRYQQMGYQGFKIKIGGAPMTQDMQRVTAAVDLAGGGRRVAVDANGRFDLATALAYAGELEAMAVRWYEEPGDPLDYELNREVIAAYDGAVATGENLFSSIDAANLLRYGGVRPGVDILQMDPGLSYGVCEYVRMLKHLERAGFSRDQCFPHGGHLINLHVVVGLGLGGCEAYPGVFQPFGGYSPQCTIENGQIRPSDAPGFGLEQKTELRPHLQALMGD